ncbi:MAG TPA: hypothetical protein VFP87_00625, partial [Chitinophagaceae bacterium]|nr:hypothetical protein [Chitinophagaceae bacterium]
KFKPGLFLRRVFFFLAINWFLINLAWYFHQTFWRIGDYQFLSQLFQGVQKVAPSWMPVPLPKPFVVGLDMAKYYDHLGGGYDPMSSFGKVTILGHSKTGGGFWYYYFVSVFYKTPIAHLIFFLWGAATVVRTRSFKNFISNEFFLFAPVVYFLMVFSFFYHTQTGLRHIIFIYPFLFISAGIIVPSIKNIYQKILLLALSVFLLISVFRYWRNYYPYTNEFISDKKMAFQYVGAANLEFKQGGLFLQHYLRTHPDVDVVPARPAAGTFVISVADYLDIWNRHQYDWIHRFDPVGQVAYTYLVFRIQPNDVRP